jgi:hypothetical protein
MPIPTLTGRNARAGFERRVAEELPEPQPKSAALTIA